MTQKRIPRITDLKFYLLPKLSPIEQQKADNRSDQNPDIRILILQKCAAAIGPSNTQQNTAAKLTSRY